MGYHIFDTEQFNPCLNETVLCTFRLVNGSIIVLIGGVGFILCVTVVCGITLNIIHLSEQQNVFVLNVLICESCIAVTGLLRGVGIISKRFAGVAEDDHELLFCYLYPLISRVFWYSKVPVLLPLTIDRFVAVAFPLHHKHWITRRTSRAMISAQWIPCIALVTYQIISFCQGKSRIKYEPFYHRCILYDENEYIEKLDAVIFTIMPFTIIAILYMVIIYHIVKSGRDCRKLLFRSSMIVLMCLVAYTPTFVFESGVKMDYACAQVFTVTLYYVNCVFDPIMYVYSDPKVMGRTSALYQKWREDRTDRGRGSEVGLVRGRLASYQAGAGMETSFISSSCNKLFVSRSSS